MLTLTHVLVATDFEAASANALAYGRELARRFGATLHVLHVAEDVAAHVAIAAGLPYHVGRLQAELEVAERQRLEALVTEQDRRELVAKLVQRVSAAPAPEIVAYAESEKIDLIVLGTHGRGAFGHLFLGSVAERVVRMAPCPVLTVRRSEREFLAPDALHVAAKA
jgi:nucleotide-binding universal stress UspA family protein